MQHCSINWANLPPELLSKISSHLKSRYDHLKFRAVCKQWRSSTPFSGHLLDSKLPLQIPSHSAIFKQSNSPILLVRTATVLLQPLDHTSSMANPWLISVEELNPGKLRPRFPLTKTTINDLPSSFPEKLDLLNCRVSVLGQGLKLCFDKWDEKVFDFYGFRGYAIKVVLLSDCDAKNVINHVDVVFALTNFGNLILFELESGELRSISYGLSDKFNFSDIVSLKGQVCAIDGGGIAYLIDGCGSSVKMVTSCTFSMVFNSFSTKLKLLVESFGDLYMIHGSCDEYFEVYKLDFELRVWDKVDSLGDQILLVTFDNCYFVDAERLPGFRGNCIVFPKDRFHAYNTEWYYPDDILFQRENRRPEINVAYLDEGIFRDCLLLSNSGLLVYFWPPPSWARPRSLSKDRILAGYKQVKE
ncbi:F-box protein At2g26160-like [Chenopodium quinoa]|nr:F-box protein At2g26160-like [Chenopodium quinoa]